MTKDEILAEYQEKRGLYRDFSQSVEAILRELLREKGIKYQFISSREKDPEKLAEKIDRKKKRVKSIRSLQILKIWLALGLFSTWKVIGMSSRVSSGIIFEVPSREWKQNINQLAIEARTLSSVSINGGQYSPNIAASRV